MWPAYVTRIQVFYVCSTPFRQIGDGKKLRNAKELLAHIRNRDLLKGSFYCTSEEAADAANDSAALARKAADCCS